MTSLPFTVNRARIEAICAEFNRTPLPAPSAVRQPSMDVLAEFRRHAQPLPPNVCSYLSVAAEALKGCADHMRERVGDVFTPSPLGFAQVVFLSEDAFDFAASAETPDAVDAVIGTAQDASGAPFDIWAWSIKSNVVASLNGRAGVNSVAAALQPRVGGGLIVHRSPLEWLRADRRSVFLIEIERAASVLRDGAPLLVNSHHFARVLRERLSIAPPPIIVADARTEMAA